MIEKNVAIAIWNENKIEKCIMEFSCGGDSMNDYSFTFYNTEDQTIESPSELSDYFEENVFNEIKFYEVSDGHYQGEAGTVEIVYDVDLEGFDYKKYSTSEFNESITVDIELSDKEYIDLSGTQQEINFFKDKILNITGSQDEFVINYKKDFIITEEIENYIKDIQSIFKDIAANADFAKEIKDYENIDYSDWYTFDISYSNGFVIEVSRNFTVYKKN